LVLSKIGPEVDLIYLVDDACPQNSATFGANNFLDPRVRVIKHSKNRGVGAAVMSGYKQALLDKATILIKLDGDGQMDPSYIPSLIYPILTGTADYTKGNRFFFLGDIGEMPNIRIFGNAVLSFFTKISSGYWNVFDPTNGYTAIHSCVAKRIPFDKVSQRYFFETDILFRLNTLKAVVVDVPIPSIYADEVSNLKVSKVAWEFFFKNITNMMKRIFYNYYLRDMSPASFELPLGLFLFIFGLCYGSYSWIESSKAAHITPPWHSYDFCIATHHRHTVNFIFFGI